VEIIKTERLLIRELEPKDAAFLLQVMTEPAFFEHIGDKGVRTEEEALVYMRERYIASYREHRFGLWHVSRLEDGVPVGISGLIKRPDLEAPDIGYGFLREFWGKGYAVEAGLGVLQYAKETLPISRILGITGFENHRSIKVLERLGMIENGVIHVEGYPEGSRLFTMDLSTASC
jgi:RimJ/RimL family protein N-acetyltransferase